MVAGAFYPAGAAQLARQVGALIASAGVRAARPTPKAVIAPHAGYAYSGSVAAAAYARLAAARGRITRVVVLGPSHHVGFRGFAVDSAAAWATPLGQVPIDRATIDRLITARRLGVLDAAHDREHAIEVQIPFLQAALGEFRLVPIVAGEAGAEAAELIDALWGGPETLIVVSTDLSHYLDYPACQAADRRTAEAIEAFDERALGPHSACGRVPVSGLLVAARRRSMEIQRLDLRNSGDAAGPRDRVVGYGSWALFEPGEAAAAELRWGLVELACRSIAAGLTTGRPKAVAVGARLPAPLRKPGAVFVTLRRSGQLRGCMGSAVAHRTLIADVVDNAFRAAFRDPRFPPLQMTELDGLDLSLAVLSPPVPMRFADEDGLLAQLRPGIDGLIVEDGGRGALFLPAVWQHLPERRRFLAQLKLKAGMAAEHWSASFRARRFETVEIEAAGPGEPALRDRLIRLVAASSPGQDS